MRKAQEKLLEKARKENMSQSQIKALSREDVKMGYLEYMYKYFQVQKEFKVEADMMADEATKCFDFLLKRRNVGYIANVTLFDELLAELLPLEKKDTLCGDNNKFKLYHLYKMAKKYVDNNVDAFFCCDLNDTMYPTCAKLLYGGADSKAVSIVVKNIMRTTKRNRFDGDAITRYRCLEDDLIHNGMGSLAVYLAENNMLRKFLPDSSLLKRLYNFDTHRFIFKNDEFFDYFKETNSYGQWYNVDEFRIASRSIKDKPLIESFSKFLDDSGLNFIAHHKQHDIFFKREYGALVYPEKNEIFRQCAKLMNQQFKVDTPAWTIAIDISTNMFVSIVYKEYNEILVMPQYGYYDNLWSVTRETYATKTVNIFITPDGKIFRRHERAGESKVIPLTIVEVLHYMNKDNFFGEVIKWIINYFGEKNGFVHDVIKDCQEVQCVMPLTLNDVLDCYNKNHFFKTKYKSSYGMSVNWNKKNINLSYMIIKAYPKIEDGVGRRALLQINDKSLVENLDCCKKLDYKTMNFISNVIKKSVIEAEKRANAKKLEKSLNELKQEISTEIGTGLLEGEFDGWMANRVEEELNLNAIGRDVFDYVRMCFLSKKKVRIDVKSVSQLTNMHDAVAHGNGGNHYRQNTGTVTIPKDTKFKHLREILPDDFEWIKSRKRLILETELQHHCVWSYAGKITSDRCAIYSFVDSNAEHADDGKPKRYTIEFDVDNKGKYGIVQVQGRYDRVHTEEMRKYIQKILDDGQKEELKAS